MPHHPFFLGNLFSHPTIKVYGVLPSASFPLTPNENNDGNDHFPFPFSPPLAFPLKARRGRQGPSLIGGIPARDDEEGPKVSLQANVLRKILDAPPPPPSLTR